MQSLCGRNLYSRPLASAVTRQLLTRRGLHLKKIIPTSGRWTAECLRHQHTTASILVEISANNDNQRIRTSLRDVGTAVTTQRSFSGGVSGGDYPPHVLFPMPALSPTMESGTIASWNLQEGDSFVAGDVLCSIETDKASVDFEAQDDGVLAKILRKGDDARDLKIGTPICVIAEEVDDVPAFVNYQPEALEEATTSPTGTETTPTAPTVGAAAATETSLELGEFVLMPSARHLAQSKGLDATVLAPGSGRGGRVTKGDVLKGIAENKLPPLAVSTATTTTATAIASPPTTASAAPTPVKLADLILPEILTDGPSEDVANSKMRKIIASRLTESKREVPHFYTSFSIELDAILKLRKALVADHDVKISVNDFVIRCAALALRDVPEVNGRMSSDQSTTQYSDSVDISIAVATPTGLITPIVFDTDKKGLADIAAAVKDLAIRARDGKLSPHEYQGGTFTISNLGMFGISEFSAVINPPQAAILAVGGGTPTFVPTPYVEGQERVPPSIATLLTARLSADRRIVDEPTAALFGQAMTHYMQQPELLIL